MPNSLNSWARLANKTKSNKPSSMNVVAETESK